MRITYGKEFERMQHFTDALVAKHKEEAEKQRLQHREVLANMSAAHRSDMKVLKDSIKEIEEDNFNKTKQLYEDVTSLTADLSSTKEKNTFLVETLSSTQAELDAANEFKDRAAGRVESLEAQLAQALHALRQAVLSSELSSTAARVADSATNEVLFHLTSSAYEANLKNVEEALSEKRQRLFALEGENRLLYERVEQLGADEETHLSTIQDLEYRRDEVEALWKDAEEKVSQLAEKVAEDTRVKIALASQIQELQSSLAEKADALLLLQESSDNALGNAAVQLREETRLHEELKQQSQSRMEEVEALKLQLAAAKEQVGRLKAALAESVTELQRSTEDCEKMRDERAAAGRLMGDIHAEVAQLKAEKTLSSRELQEMTQKAEALALQVKDLQSNGLNLNSEVLALRKMTASLEATHVALTHAVALKKSECDALREKCEEIGGQCEEWKAQAEASASESKSMHAKIFDMHYKNEGLRDRVENLSMDLDAYRRRVLELENERKEILRSAAELAGVDKRLKEAVAEAHALKAEMDRKDAELEQQGQVVEELRRSIEEQKKDDGMELEDYKRSVIELESERDFLRGKLDADLQVSSSSMPSDS